uniref:Uncharacterized protein n=1 Tax=Haptolina ericina TaxID=156174 RepID=A0A7S3BTG6_9EUKA
MMMVIGDFIDYFRPVKGKTFCEMIVSDKYHEWSYDGLQFHSLEAHYHDGNSHFGGAVGGTPAKLGDSSRTHVPFWGKKSSDAGGCCQLSTTDTVGWGKPFDMYVQTRR